MSARSHILGMTIALVVAGCGKDNPPPPKPAPAPMPTPVTGAPPAPAAKQEDEAARKADREAFDELEKLKLARLNGWSLKYDISLGDKELKEDGTIKPEVMNHLKKLTRPTELSLREIAISDAGLGQVKEIRAVDALVMGKDKRITDQGLVNLSGMDQLKELFLFDQKLGDGAYAALKGLKGLKKIYISGAGFNDPAFENLKGLAELESFGLEGADNVTAAGLTHLKSLPKLKRLTLESFKKDTKLNAAALKEVGALATLEELLFGVIEPISLSGKVPWVDDAGVAHLGKLTNLKKLNLGCCEKVTDQGLAHLKGLTKLEQLNIGNTKVTDAGLVNLKGMSNLQELNLNCLKISEKGLAHLTGLSKLRQLRLRECGEGVNDKTIQQLKSLSGLKGLMVYDTGVTKKGAEELKKTLPELSVDTNN
jgi:Leucine-rich repeat (LRR) protein